jgi:hypothetical protein
MALRSQSSAYAGGMTTGPSRAVRASALCGSSTLASVCSCLVQTAQSGTHDGATGSPRAILCSSEGSRKGPECRRIRCAKKPHLPRGQPGKPRVDDRRVISGILHVLKVGCRWRDASPPNSTAPRRTISAFSREPSRPASPGSRSSSRTCGEDGSPRPPPSLPREGRCKRSECCSG